MGSLVQDAQTLGGLAAVRLGFSVPREAPGKGAAQGVETGRGFWSQAGACGVRALGQARSQPSFPPCRWPPIHPPWGLSPLRSALCAVSAHRTFAGNPGENRSRCVFACIFSWLVGSGIILNPLQHPAPGTRWEQNGSVPRSTQNFPPPRTPHHCPQASGTVAFPRRGPGAWCPEPRLPRGTAPLLGRLPPKGQETSLLHGVSGESTVNTRIQLPGWRPRHRCGSLPPDDGTLGCLHALTFASEASGPRPRGVAGRTWHHCAPIPCSSEAGGQSGLKSGLGQWETEVQRSFLLRRPSKPPPCGSCHILVPCQGPPLGVGAPGPKMPLPRRGLTLQTPLGRVSAGGTASPAALGDQQAL